MIKNILKIDINIYYPILVIKLSKKFNFILIKNKFHKIYSLYVIT